MSPTAMTFSTARMAGALNPINGLRTLAWRIGFAIRETGQALERTGLRLQGIYSHEEVLNRHMPVAPSKWSAPSIAEGTFVAPSGLVLGDVSIGKSSSIWYNAIIRGDWTSVTIGNNVNIQDSAYVGSSSEFSPPVVIDDNVSVGHAAVLKGCTVHSHSLIGINAVISEGCVVGPNSIVAAGAYVEENAVVPSGEVWAGNPAKKLRDVKPKELEYLSSLPSRYVELAGQHNEVLSLLKAKQKEYMK